MHAYASRGDHVHALLNALRTPGCLCHTFGVFSNYLLPACAPFSPLAMDRHFATELIIWGTKWRSGDLGDELSKCFPDRQWAVRLIMWLRLRTPRTAALLIPRLLYCGRPAAVLPKDLQ